MSVLIVIPARMKATRLPNKPMAMIGDAPMIVQVWRRAVASGVGEVLVACDGELIADAIIKAGGKAVLTNPDHPSGSDRIWEAINKFERASATPHQHYETIINLQGDVPTIDPQNIRDVLEPLADPSVDIATLVTPITRAEEHENPSVVKAVLALKDNEKIGRALYFTRATAPYGEGVRYHHIGVYAYRRAALAAFVALPPSPLEVREKLEQLRALEHGLRIDGRVVDTVPLGVDTPEDLIRAQEILRGA